MRVWGGVQGVGCAGLPGSLSPGSGRGEEGRSLVGNEEIAFLRRSSPTGLSVLVSQVERKEGGFECPQIWPYSMARGGLLRHRSLATSSIPSDAS